jgi:hypothetical protein
MSDGGLHVTTRAICVPCDLTVSACTDPDAVVPDIVLTGPDLLLTKVQTCTSYLVSGVRAGVMYSVREMFLVLLQLYSGPLFGLSRYLSRWSLGGLSQYLS